MMIEQNTNYAYKLKYMENPTFDKVRALSTKFYWELPQELQDELYEKLHRGIDVLDTEPLMLTYLYAFGPMHQAKLNYAFDKLSEDFPKQSEINVIDYGCGQALGTMCYADFLRENGYKQKVKSISLIEPSEMCLKRAALHASIFFPHAKIKTINKKFDDLTKDDIVCDENTPTLHILSNVLDMLNFDLEQFSNLVKNCLKGYNQFVCVGPYFFDQERDKRINKFHTSIDRGECFSKLLEQFELNHDKKWTAQILCFSFIDTKSFYSSKKSHLKSENEFEQYLKSAKHGDCLCQYYVGLCYYYGEEVKQDYLKAVDWLRKAAEQGSILSQCQLGICYYMGHGVKQDYEKAFEWFRKSVKYGNHSEGEWRIGNCYYYGNGVKQDFTKAVEWYTKAAEKNFAQAQYSIGLCYLNGKGVAKNLRKATEWIEKSAEQGHKDGQLKLGCFYYSGEGVKQDFTKAAEWFKKSAEQGHALSQCLLGCCYYYGNGIKRDYSKAAEWFKKSAEQGHVGAQKYLGECFMYGRGVERNLQKAAEWYAMEADKKIDLLNLEPL